MSSGQVRRYITRRVPPPRQRFRDNRQPDKGPALCACGGRLTAMTDFIFGNSLIACERCGKVER